MTSNAPPRPQRTSNDVPRVLLVDDADEYRRLLERRLRLDHGLEVLHATNGLAALTLLERERVDVVVADLLMPGMDGVTLLKTVGKRWPSARRVLLSGWTTAELVVSSAYEVLDKGLAAWVITGHIAALAEKSA